MPLKFKPNHPLRQLKSFKFAFEGLFHAIMTEPNFRIQMFIVSLSFVLGKFLQISDFEWMFLVTSLGFLLMMELFNTVIEEIMDQLFKDKREGVKVIKDLSAAAVMVASFTVLTNLIIIFGSRLF